MTQSRLGSGQCRSQDNHLAANTEQSGPIHIPSDAGSSVPAQLNSFSQADRDETDGGRGRDEAVEGPARAAAASCLKAFPFVGTNNATSPLAPIPSIFYRLNESPTLYHSQRVSQCGFEQGVYTETPCRFSPALHNLTRPQTPPSPMSFQLLLCFNIICRLVLLKSNPHGWRLYDVNGAAAATPAVLTPPTPIQTGSSETIRCLSSPIEDLLHSFPFTSGSDMFVIDAMLILRLDFAEMELFAISSIEQSMAVDSCEPESTLIRLMVEKLFIFCR
ncbi:hypothetical protein BDK51DRAFT_45550 [Blyttiomyces helicus]|uniref:Uncharacterized protein n=1 Tax=Blyttiomyces helicus TaxID=388810 RepID=A0A4P9W9R9_9FUNG|nr:hypothetical protein BDK51DRAFT_45550 [Blyttiomyces helicus]|eukprot:RKO87878.1 hypothetical protein BDK51DRAFT_45550 [Blyttiomyces helicus]